MRIFTPNLEMQPQKEVMLMPSELSLGACGSVSHVTIVLREENLLSS